MLNGNGKEVSKDGTIYEGNWKDDKRYGQGPSRMPMATVMKESGRMIC
jgi:hypothetical protein